MWADIGRALVATGLLTLLAHACWTDLRRRRIANRTCAAIVLLWPTQLALASPPPAMAAALPVALAVGAACTLLWRGGLIGGGDVKLLTALALWAGPARVVEFLLLVGLAGGILAAAWLGCRRIGATLSPVLVVLPGNAAAAVATLTAAPLPYGLAIAAGGTWLAFTLLRG